jgi:hypothetical protein
MRVKMETHCPIHPKKQLQRKRRRRRRRQKGNPGGNSY